MKKMIIAAFGCLVCSLSAQDTTENAVDVVAENAMDVTADVTADVTVDAGESTDVDAVDTQEVSTNEDSAE